MATGARARGRREVCRYVIGHAAAKGLRAIPGRLVAAHTIGRVQRVIVVYMAGSAGRGVRRHVRARKRKAGDAVVERALVGPGNRVVALRAICDRKDLLIACMGRIVGLIVGGQVTAGIATVAGCDLQIIVVIDVALRARHRGMCVGQGETRAGMVKGRSSPAGGVMASGALRHRETGGDVIGNTATQGLRAVPILQMTGRIPAIVGLNGQSEVVADVTGGARRRGGRDVHPGQGEASHAVVERGQIGPCNGVVALRAIRCGEGGPRGGMRRIVGLLPGSEVAACIAAVGRSDLQIIVVVDVALRAGKICVAVGQRETGRGMIEGRSVPAYVVVTVVAGRDRKRLRIAGVRRIIRGLPGAEVAAGISAIAIRNILQIVVVVDVALRTGKGGVRAVQDEARDAVIKRSAKPAIEVSVAILTIGRGKSRPSICVRGIIGFLPIGQVAGLALCGKTVENSRRGLLVAFFALYRGVRTEQRESIQVIFNLLDGDAPALNGVALRAVRTHLVTVHVFVGMAVDAILADVCKYRLDMALRALDLFVHSAQGVFGFVVIEFRNGTYRFPTRRGMTVFAGYGQGTMRATRRPFLRLSTCGLLSACVGSRSRRAGIPGIAGRKGENCPESELEDSRRNVLHPALGPRLLEKRQN